MAGQNDITGDVLINKVGNREAFDRNFDAIFGKKKQNNPPERPSQEWDKPETETVFRFSHGSEGIKPESISMELVD